jgi:hypothetical protein
MLNFYLTNMYIFVMKISTSLILIFVATVIVILSLTCSCMKYVPYSEDTIFAKQFPYEGFTSNHPPLEYTTTPGQTSIDSYQSFSIDPTVSDCKRVYGFDGLYCKPYVADNIINPFAETKGSAQCTGKSSGLSNSQGGLCLTDNQKNLLATRGGNASGAATSK